MGVLACDRRDCDNIMCDTIIDGRYYVCNECRGAFYNHLIVKKSKGEKLYLDSRSFLLEEFKNFMEIPVEDARKIEFTSEEKEVVDEFFREGRRSSW